MTNGNNNKNSYAKEAILPTVATLEAKNFKVKYDFLNFSQGTCRLKCMRTMTLMIIWVSVLKFENKLKFSDQHFFTPRYYKQQGHSTTVSFKIR